MDNILKKQIRKNMDIKTTEELLQIMEQNDREQWSVDALEVVREILSERGQELKTEATINKDTETAEVEYDRSSFQFAYFLSLFIPGMGHLILGYFEAAIRWFKSSAIALIIVFILGYIVRYFNWRFNSTVLIVLGLPVFFVWLACLNDLKALKAGKALDEPVKTNVVENE